MLTPVARFNLRLAKELSVAPPMAMGKSSFAVLGVTFTWPLKAFQLPPKYPAVALTRKLSVPDPDNAEVKVAAVPEEPVRLRGDAQMVAV